MLSLASLEVFLLGDSKSSWQSKWPSRLTITYSSLLSFLAFCLQTFEKHIMYPCTQFLPQTQLLLGLSEPSFLLWYIFNICLEFRLSPLGLLSWASWFYISHLFSLPLILTLLLVHFIFITVASFLFIEEQRFTSEALLPSCFLSLQCSF